MSESEKICAREIQELKRQNNWLQKQLNKEKKQSKKLRQKLRKYQQNLPVKTSQFIENKIKQKQRDQFFDLSLDLVCIANFNGYFLDVNSTWERKLGYPKTEFLSKAYINFIHPEDVENTIAQAEKLSQGNQAINFENRYRCRKGNYIWLSWMAIPLPEQGIIYAIAHDITEQKQLEIDLKSSRQELQRIIECIPGAIVYIDKELCFRYVNHNYEQWIDKSQAEILGKYIWEILGEKAYQVLQKTVEQVLIGQYACYQGKLPLDDGQVYDIDARFVPDLNQQGEVQGYYALVYDLTEKAKAQAQIRLQWTAIESAIDGISILENGRFIYANHSKLKIFGYESQEEILGKKWHQLYSRTELMRFKQEIFPSLKQDKSWQGEVIAQRKDGTNFVEEISFTLIDEDVAIAVCRDISQKKRAEEALRIAEENYRSIFENALEGIFQSSPDGYYLKVNPAMAKIHGYQSSAEMIANVQHIDQQIYVDSNIRAQFQLLLNQENTINNFEYQVYRRDGKIIWLQESTRAVCDDKGNLLYYEGMVHDITERKQKEEILKRQIEELRTCIDQNQRQQVVNNILKSDYFKEIQSNLEQLRINR
jgi:PAS domain S-box-containing protein